MWTGRLNGGSIAWSLEATSGTARRKPARTPPSPNAAFKNTQELNFKLAWDDSDTLGKWAVHPWINLAIETENTSFGPNSGEGVQLGKLKIAPQGLKWSTDGKAVAFLIVPAASALAWLVVGYARYLDKNYPQARASWQRSVARWPSLISC